MTKEEDARSGIKCRRCDYDYPVGQLNMEGVCPVCDAPRPMRMMARAAVPVTPIRGKSLVA
jgi:Zn finger protein HypA/HybF involved in hydrogenase expression